MENYKVVIDETARNRPSDGTHTFNRTEELFKSIDATLIKGGSSLSTRKSVSFFENGVEVISILTKSA